MIAVVEVDGHAVVRDGTGVKGMINDVGVPGGAARIEVAGAHAQPAGRLRRIPARSDDVARFGNVRAADRRGGHRPLGHDQGTVAQPRLEYKPHLALVIDKGDYFEVLLDGDLLAEAHHRTEVAAGRLVGRALRPANLNLGPAAREIGHAVNVHARLQPFVCREKAMLRIHAQILAPGGPVNLPKVAALGAVVKLLHGGSRAAVGAIRQWRCRHGAPVIHIEFKRLRAGRCQNAKGGAVIGLISQAPLVIPAVEGAVDKEGKGALDARPVLRMQTNLKIHPLVLRECAIHVEDAPRTVGIKARNIEAAVLVHLEPPAMAAALRAGPEARNRQCISGAQVRDCRGGQIDARPLPTPNARPLAPRARRGGVAIACIEVCRCAGARRSCARRIGGRGRMVRALRNVSAGGLLLDEPLCERPVEVLKRRALHACWAGRRREGRRSSRCRSLRWRLRWRLGWRLRWRPCRRFCWCLGRRLHRRYCRRPGSDRRARGHTCRCRLLIRSRRGHGCQARQRAGGPHCGRLGCSRWRVLLHHGHVEARR